MKVTRYFEATREREDRRHIRDEWIEQVICDPIKEVVQSDGRIRRWAAIAAAGDRFLRRPNSPQRFLRQRFHAMKVRFFEDTDTLYIELRHGTVADTRDIDENTLVDVDAQGQMLAITIEHATSRAELSELVYQRVAA